MDPKLIIEAALLVAGHPLNIDRLQSLFDESERPSRDAVRQHIDALREDWSGRGIELVEVSTGYRFHTRQDLAPWISRLWEERRPRYSRALMETLALIAYRQPITRAEIEDVRGVTVSTNIIKTLLEREWIRVVGHREVPGRPALYGTTKQFLDQFNLKNLDELPPLVEVRSLDEAQADLDLEALTPADEQGTDEQDTDEQASDEHGDPEDEEQALPDEGDETSYDSATEQDDDGLKHSSVSNG